jgi:hypothetical protein
LNSLFLVSAIGNDKERLFSDESLFEQEEEEEVISIDNGFR